LEITDKKYRMVSAMHSARSAVEGGWATGGGVALYKAAGAIRTITASEGAEVEGLASVATALEKPIQHLIENAQSSPTQVLQEMSQATGLFIGFNVDTKRVEDLRETGILDSTRMLEIALRVAHAHAKSILETEDWDLAPNPPPQTPVT